MHFSKKRLGGIGMKYCKKCGSQGDDHAKFCTNCGAPFSEDQPDRGNTYSHAQASSENHQTDHPLSQTSYDRAQNTYNRQRAADSQNPYGHQNYSQQGYGQQNYDEQRSFHSQNAYGSYEKGSGFGTPGYGVGSNLGIESRNIPLALIFSIITCGLYAIYWLIMLNDEINQLAGETDATTGGMVFLFSVITCGLYHLYWLFKMGERCERIKGVGGSLHVLFLVLGIFGFGLIAYCLIQDTINKTIS